jgi:hypothetical protein
MSIWPGFAARTLVACVSVARSKLTPGPFGVLSDNREAFGRYSDNREAFGRYSGKADMYNP